MRFLFLIPLCALAGTVFGQGSLTPPGAPAPTMKTLDQIEARTPIPGGTAPYTISASGSYYLTGNITVASGDVITVTALNVTLDLNGFTIATTAASPSGTAVYLKQGSDHVTIRNGFIQGAGYAASGTYSGGGFQDGVTTERPVSEGSSASDLVVNGCAGYGIRLVSSGYGGTRVERCIVENIGDGGISADVVTSCKAFYCVTRGISAENVSDCTAQGFGGGITAINASNCYGQATSGLGIACTTARGCTGSSNSGVGLSATNADACSGTTQSTTAAGLTASSSAMNCRGFSVGGVGLYAVAATACYGTSNTGIGLQAGTGTDCVGGTTTGPHGAYANCFTNSQGVASGKGGVGLQAYYTAVGCLGISQDRDGLVAGVATNCFGQTSSTSYAGLVALGAANSCRGYNTAATSTQGTALNAQIAIGCTSQQGSISAVSKFLGTP